MITEAEVWRALEVLPEESLIRGYVSFASRQVSSNVVYHVPAVLSLLGVCTPGNFAGRGFKRETFPNFYGMIVGSSGDAEKTLSIDIPQKILSISAPALLGFDPTAEETLAKGLANRPAQLFIYPDMGAFLSKTSGNDPRGAGLRDGFMSYFDGLSMTREYSKGPPVLVSNPRPSFLGACTPEHLEEYTTSIDWHGGGMSRFFVAYGERERDLPHPEAFPEGWTYLQGFFAWLATREGAKACAGMTPEAAALWKDWQKNVIQRYVDRGIDTRLRGLVARVRLVAAKCTCLVAVSVPHFAVSDSPAGEWWITPQLVESGIALAELHLKGALALAENVAPNEEMREQRALYRACGASWTPLGEVLKRSHLTKRRALPYFETLREHGAIEERVQNTTAYYRQVPGGEARPYDPGMDNLPPPPPVGGAVVTLPPPIPMYREEG